MATFVLVHSMWHGAWSFDPLKARLEAQGHMVLAEDLASCGEDPTPPAQVTLARWVDDTSHLVSRAGEKVVLVGHSRGGLVVSQTAEAVPDDVAVSVYVTALMVPHGKSGISVPQIMAETGADASASLTVAPRMSDDGTALLAPVDAAESIYGSVDEATRAWALPRLGTEPLMPLATPLALTEDRYGRVPRVYVETTLDRTLPIAAQRAMIAASPPVEVVTLQSDHLPTVTHVDQLAAILIAIAAQYVRPVVSAAS